MAVHVLGGGMGHDIGTPFNGAAVDGGGKGVIHNQRHTVGVGCIGKLFNIQYRQGGVGNGFAKDSLVLGWNAAFSSSSVQSGETKVAVMPIFAMVTEIRLKVPP